MVVHHCLVLPPGTHGFAGGRPLENQCPPASIRSLELATFHAPHRHTTQPTQKPPESGGLLVLNIRCFIPTALFQPVLARLRQLGAYTAPVRNRSD